MDRWSAYDAPSWRRNTATSCGPTWIYWSFARPWISEDVLSRCCKRDSRRWRNGFARSGIGYQNTAVGTTIFRRGLRSHALLGIRCEAAFTSSAAVRIEAKTRWKCKQPHVKNLFIEHELETSIELIRPRRYNP